MLLESARIDELINEIDAGPPTLRIDALTSQVWIRGKEVHVEPREFELLRLLCAKAGSICTHAQIRDALFPNSDMLVPSSKAVVYPLIFKLRQVLEIVPEEPRILLSKHGKGYVLTVQCTLGTN
jgi:DNA-binding response OmpR family regulator